MSAYDLINTTTGHQVTSVHFNLSGYSQGVVHGLISSVEMVEGVQYTFNVDRTSHQQNNEYDDFVACFTTGTRLPQRWSRDFGPVAKVDRRVKEMIPNDEENEPLSGLQSQGCA